MLDTDTYSIMINLAQNKVILKSEGIMFNWSEKKITISKDGATLRVQKLLFLGEMYLRMQCRWFSE